MDKERQYELLDTSKESINSSDETIDILKEMKIISTKIFQGMLDFELRIPSKIEIQDFAISQQLNCALTLETIKLPAKTNNCKHFWSIELEYFKELTVCPCKQPITQDNIIIDQLFLRLINVIQLLNKVYFQENSLFKYESEVMFFKRSLLFFPCYDQQSIPQPLPLLQEHIRQPSELNLSYNFSFKIIDLISCPYKIIVRTCQQFCIYNYDKLEFYNQVEQCQFCERNIDVFSFQIDSYLIKVRELLLYYYNKENPQCQETITLIYGKFKIQKQLFTIENIDGKLVQMKKSQSQ